jgi:hypothetical protein
MLRPRACSSKRLESAKTFAFYDSGLLKKSSENRRRAAYFEAAVRQPISTAPHYRLYDPPAPRYGGNM